MTTGRDDFVIAIRSAFLKKGNKQRFSLIALIIFSFILIILSRINFAPINYLKSGLNEIVYRVSFVVSLPEQQMSSTIRIINNHLSLYEEHDELKKKLNKLKAKDLNTKYLSFENERLRKLIDEYIFDSEELVAKVLLDKESPFLRSVILNKGSREKLKIGMAVLDGPYLVGKVVEVNYATSRVLLISDLNSKIPVILEPGNIQSIMSGNGANTANIQYFKNDNNLSGKKIIFTSGSGGIFKSGIPVGEITTENKINFFSNLSQLTFVKVVSYTEEVK